MERVKTVAEMLDLTASLNQRASGLTADGKQKISLGRGLVRSDVNIMMFDEPLTVIDPHLKWQLRSELKQLHRRVGFTMVYVTHDQSEALTMSNRIAVFDDGVIQQLAAPDMLYEAPENAFVAQFIGENNTLYGKVIGLDGDICTVEAENGDKLKALGVNIQGVGFDTMISLRPERVVVNPESGQCSGTVTGKVEELIYLGDHIRSRMNVCGQDDFIVKIPNSANHAQLSPGDTVQIGWKAEDARALDVLVS